MYPNPKSCYPKPMPGVFVKDHEYGHQLQVSQVLCMSSFKIFGLTNAAHYHRNKALAYSSCVSSVSHPLPPLIASRQHIQRLRDAPCTRLDCCKILHKLYQHFPGPRNGGRFRFLTDRPLVHRVTGSTPHKHGNVEEKLMTDNTPVLQSAPSPPTTETHTPYIFKNLLFVTTRSVFKSVKVSVVEIAKRTN